MSFVPIIAFALHVGAGRQHPDAWFSADKLKHFALGTLTQSLGYGTVRVLGGTNRAAFVGGSLATTSVALLKELHDRRVHGDVSAKDFCWTVTGGAATQVLLSQTRR